MRLGIAALGLLICLPVWKLAAQAPTPMLNIVVVEGDDAINNIRQRTAREPIVQVQDENHKPIAGAAVVFTLPTSGASGTFANGAHTLTVLTDDQGRAVAHGLRPNGIQGKVQIRVTASFRGQTAGTTITQTNAVTAAGAGGAAGGAAISGKLIAIIVIVGAAAAGGAIAATHLGGGNNNNNNNSGVPAGPSIITITPGTGTVGPPH